MIIELILLFVSIFLLVFLFRPKRPENFPPGPTNYPIVGAGFLISKLAPTVHGAFKVLGERYGTIVGLYLGSQRGVIINGYEATKEFYTHDEFAHRPFLFLNTYRWGGRMLGVFFSNGRLWQENRRFTLRHLRDFGFGKTSMEGLIHEEAEECISSITKAVKNSTNSIISVDDKFGVSVINILWAIMGGTRYSHEDENFKTLLKIVQKSFRAGNPSGSLVVQYPFLRHFPYFKQQFEDLDSGSHAICKLVEESIDEHAKTRDPTSPRDLIDAYLQAMDETKEDTNTVYFKDQLIQVCEDFFAAGSESTSNSVAYAVLHMIRNPKCQEKMQKELDTVVGRDRLPSYDDKANLPYTFAVVTENLRMSPVAPISVPHLCLEDTKLMGYNIPKNTWAMVNYTSTNMDKSYFGDPENFRPERFLDENGQFIKEKLDHVHGFGAGKRQCLGEPLARISNFLLFTAVMQRLKFEAVPGQPLPSIIPIDGFTVAPQPFSAKITQRY